MTEGELSSLIWTIRVEILGDRSDRFHLNALIFELQKHNVFDDEVEIENYENSTCYSKTLQMRSEGGNQIHSKLHANNCCTISGKPIKLKIRSL